MACKIILPFWPTALEAIQWSRDNRIAVLGGESIAILTPRLDNERTMDGVFWDKLVVKINEFTSAEIPRTLPLPEDVWSLGEELSINTAHSAAWSAPGLAKYGTCALAVLTTNHVLSIWAADRKPFPSTQWRREIVINHAVQDFYKQRGPGKVQVVQRIQAFAWSRPWCQAKQISGRADSLVTSHHFIAVATHGGHILFMRIASPMREIWRIDMDWRATICGHLDMNIIANDDAHMIDVDDVRQSSGDASSNETQRPIADSFAWSRWNMDDNTSTLAFTAEGKLFSIDLQLLELDGAFTIRPAKFNARPRTMLEERSDLNGPLYFIENSSSDSLIVFGEDIVCQIGCNAPRHESLNHHLDGRWDGISGFALTESESDADSANVVQMNFTSHLSTLTSATARLILPIRDQDPPRESETIWHKELQALRDAYSAERNLGHPHRAEGGLASDAQYQTDTGVQERAWGIASSPFRNYVATCVTFHPSETLEYAIQTEQTTTVNITAESKYPAASLLSPRAKKMMRNCNATAETIAFQIGRSQEPKANDSDVPKLDFSNIVRSIESATPDLETQLNNESTSNTANNLESTLSNIHHYLRSKLVFASEARRLRTRRLARFIMAHHGEQQASVDVVKRERDPNVEMIRILIEAVLTIPNHDRPAVVISEEDPLGCMIRNIHRVILGKLNALQTEQTHVGGRAEVNAVEGNEDLSTSFEHCETCNTPIKFESLKWARCSNSRQVHQFPRCALTFLAIQQPQQQAQSPMTKSCGLCELRFFSDEGIFELSQRLSRTQVRRPDDVPLQAGFLRNTNLAAGAHTDNQNLGAPSAQPGSTPADPELLENNIGEKDNSREQNTSHAQHLDSSSSTSSSPSANSLAIAMYATCSVCFYCGGQYAD
jgi:hypothetical protein